MFRKTKFVCPSNVFVEIPLSIFPSLIVLSRLPDIKKNIYKNQENQFQANFVRPFSFVSSDSHIILAVPHSMNCHLEVEHSFMWNNKTL
ncbi:hypothetical protein BpHYR1_021265 [Brachionus plicatilis]|uniref:Uncharacterized protein n=1 Tax=Brachionus plicatilis TaxID=10195 RepID=A0A3M7SBR0_BRAPC|nr:hypothetical protein BpHYR1_021265 [Brachionus plicatilis]